MKNSLELLNSLGLPITNSDFQNFYIKMYKNRVFKIYDFNSIFYIFLAKKFIVIK